MIRLIQIGVIMGSIDIDSILSSILALFVSVKHKKSKYEPVTPKSVFLGISFIKRRPIILGAMSLDLFAVCLGAPRLYCQYMPKIFIY